jgi:tripartite-type tricarboxylate transporter receptor subunit TctC
MSALQRRSIIQAGASAALAAGGLGLAPWARAQAYPSKPITIIVSYPAGGDTDALGRLFAEKLSTRLNQQVVVENRPGASGTIGNAFVAKSAPDGHTLLMTPSTISSALLVLKPGTGGSYDTVNDFTPVFHMGTQQLFLVVNAQTGIKNVKELIAAARADKIKTYGSPGSGSPMHILGEMFNRSTSLKIQQVRGTLTNIGVADNARSPFAPGVPTLEEQGVRGANLGAWQGIMGPKGMRPEVVSLLNGHFNEILKMPDVQARMSLATTVPTGGEPRYLGRTHQADHDRMAVVINDLGIKAD